MKYLTILLLLVGMTGVAQSNFEIAKKSYQQINIDSQKPKPIDVELSDDIYDKYKIEKADDKYLVKTIKERKQSVPSQKQSVTYYTVDCGRVEYKPELPEVKAYAPRHGAITIVSPGYNGTISYIIR